MKKLLCLLLFLVSGCQQTINYDYWVTHIGELEKKYSECQQKDGPHCAEVKRAAHDVSELIYEQATDPESFGKKIIALQDALKKNENDEQLRQLKIMYAIIALHGPE